MKKLFLLMFVGVMSAVLLSVPVFAQEESKVTITGSIQGMSCVTQNMVCPIGMEDAMAAMNDTLVLLVDAEKADYYHITNVSQMTLARHINDTVKVAGYVNKKHKQIWVEAIFRGERLLWDVKMQKELHQQMMKNMK
jgi:hypothetical protein